MNFFEYELCSEALHIGERIKKGTFRPVVPVLELNEVKYQPVPYSTVTGALREFLGLAYDVPVHAAGYLNHGNIETLVIAPRDNVTGVSRLPITIQYISQAKGRIFIKMDGNAEKLPEQFDMMMGGLRYKGLGSCHLRRIGILSQEMQDIKEGEFLTRTPEEVLHIFGIDTEKLKRDGPYRWGYLFKPTSITGGVYVKSLFEGSQIEAYSFLLEVTK